MSIISSFIYAMASHPEIQSLARNHLDAVLQGNRLPTPQDRPLVPYVDAIMREVLRWQPPGPLTVPHASSEDDLYKGYFIRKGGGHST